MLTFSFGGHIYKACSSVQESLEGFKTKAVLRSSGVASNFFPAGSRAHCTLFHNTSAAALCRLEILLAVAALALTNSSGFLDQFL